MAGPAGRARISQGGMPIYSLDPLGLVAQPGNEGGPGEEGFAGGKEEPRGRSSELRG